MIYINRLKTILNFYNVFDNVHKYYSELYHSEKTGELYTIKEKTVLKY